MVQNYEGKARTDEPDADPRLRSLAAMTIIPLNDGYFRHQLSALRDHHHLFEVPGGVPRFTSLRDLCRLRTPRIRYMTYGCCNGRALSLARPYATHESGRSPSCKH